MHVIPVLNKIDLPSAQPDKYAAELAGIIGVDPSEVLRVSAKTGENVAQLLNRIVDQVPAPVGDAAAPARALIFDSVYDTYRGVVTYVRVVDGALSHRERVLMMSTKAAHETLEVGVISPEPVKADSLGVGEVGYLITGVKEVRQSRVGDTVTSLARPATQDLGGYRHPHPMVFAGLYPIDGADYPELREALDKLQLNDAALSYEPETSGALGFGFRIGFLGLLHMEIVRERLEREFNLDLISTAPNVVYRVILENGTELTVTNPSEYPTGGKIAEVYEPVVKATILTPADYIGTVLELCQTRRGVQRGMDYLSEDRVEIRYTVPLAEIVFDFFDALKSRTKGYASLDYEPSGEQLSDLVKVDILLHGEPVDAFSAIVHKDKAYSYGLSMVGKLKELIPRQQFEVPIQAAIGSRVIARETIRAIRKDVLAKCYGGDITRKRKLLEKQKEGKKRMKMVGRVEVPQEAFVAALSTTEAAAGGGQAAFSLTCSQERIRRSRQMWALQFDEYGGPDVIHLGEAPEPHAGPGKIRITVKAASINGIDRKISSGVAAGGKPLEGTGYLGFDAAGVVDEIGDGVSGVAIGDDVFGCGIKDAGRIRRARLLGAQTGLGRLECGRGGRRGG